KPCQISAAEIAAATGLPAEAIRLYRRELLQRGEIIVGRPRGESPEILLPRWRCKVDSGPASLASHQAAAARAVDDAANDLGILLRAAAEMGADDRAELLAG